MKGIKYGSAACYLEWEDRTLAAKIHNQKPRVKSDVNAEIP